MVSSASNLIESTHIYTSCDPYGTDMTVGFQGIYDTRIINSCTHLSCLPLGFPPERLALDVGRRVA